MIRYGRVTAVDGVSFTAAGGEVTVLLGPNGAGKTSTVEHLEGYIPSASGHSTVLGLDPIRDRRELASRMGIMLQNGGIPMAIRPVDALRQYAGFFDDPMDPHDVMERVGLTDRARIPYRRLSGGERQRLSLGLAIIGRPEVLFLDEPSAGVDLSGRDSINEIVTELRDGGACVLVTTHDLAEAEELADRVVIIDEGRIVADGRLSELLSGGDRTEMVFTTTSGFDVAAMSRRLGLTVSRLSAHDHRVELPSEDPRVRTETIAAIADACLEADIGLVAVRTGATRLDDVFRSVTTTYTPTGAGRDPAGVTAGSGRRHREEEDPR